MVACYRFRDTHQKANSCTDNLSPSCRWCSLNGPCRVRNLHPSLHSYHTVHTCSSKEWVLAMMCSTSIQRCSCETHSLALTCCCALRWLAKLFDVGPFDIPEWDSSSWGSLLEHVAACLQRDSEPEFVRHFPWRLDHLSVLSVARGAFSLSSLGRGAPVLRGVQDLVRGRSFGPRIVLRACPVLSSLRRLSH